MAEARSKRTKIVCTIGPASRAPETLRRMIHAGLDVARINFSHGTPAERAEDFATVRRIAREERALVAIMADLQGPKLRIGQVDPEPLRLAAGDRVVLTAYAAKGEKGRVEFPHPETIAALKAGDRLVVGDGELELVVREKRPSQLLCEAAVGGDLYSHKGVSVPPGTPIGSALTPKDREDVDFALEQGADFLALSFVRSGRDVLELRSLIESRGGSAAIVAKIEKREALQDFASILDASDAVMVARGDLGTEIPVEEVPFRQKEIIRECNAAGKPVITATQMLQSMIDHPQPTRAETSDAANAVLDGTDAVMLSGETAVGRYPVASVETLAKIAATVEEKMLPWVGRPNFAESRHREPITDAISNATVTIARELGARLILTSTSSGYTARQVARERPAQPIVAFTQSEATLRQLALSWGVVPLPSPLFAHSDALLEGMTRTALSTGLATKGDLVVITGGLPRGGGGRTNFLKIERL
jgi:pyruvate kinase